jgi:hypothetical protein
MANVLTALAADLYKSAEIVGRSAVGFIPSVTVNAGAQAAAQNTVVRSFVTTEGTINTSVTPSMTIPEGDDNTVGAKTMTLDKTTNAQIPFTGEDQLYLDQSSGFQTVYGALLTRKMNGMVRQIEADIATEAYKNSTRAFGTAGTNPFASDFDAIAEVRQILFDNEMPVDDGQLSMIVNSVAGTKLRNQAQLQKANESGGTELLRQGTLLDLQGFMLKESHGVQSHVKGTATGALVNGALSEGDTEIAFDGATAGASGIKAGDVITFAADTTNKYVVTVGATGASGTIQIATPGLRAAIPDNNAITIGANYTANIGMHRSAMELAIRPMASPMASAAQEQMIVQDPHSGLAFQVEVYGGYKKAMVDITAIYGVKAWQPDAIATLLG